MATNERTVEILNDLILINNDRIAGYERAMQETDALDIDLKGTFESLKQDSEHYRKQLADQVTALGGTPDDGTTTAGKIYRLWMDVKGVFTGNDRKSILESCERGEDAAQQAYRDALSNREDLVPQAYEMVGQQKDSLKMAHELIKKYRDAHQALG